LANSSRYIVAKLVKPLLGCSTASLRALNVAAICLICLVSYGILRTLRRPGHQDEPQDVRGPGKHSGLSDLTILLDANTALNIALFPPLFFFSALFYTDVMSTLVVLLSYGMLVRKRTASGNFLENLGTIVIGVVALFLRQTNIFWVAVFPAGLSVVEALKTDATRPEGKTPTTMSGILEESWKHGTIYDCAVQDTADLQGTHFSPTLRTITELTRIRLWALLGHCCDCTVEASNTSIASGPPVCRSPRNIRKFRVMEWKCCPWYVQFLVDSFKTGRLTKDR
jgi:hypothetical protein